jgi:pimeloyl-ACP methyl ester carboxylesterase
MNEPIVLIGGLGSHWRQYQSFGRALANVSGRRVFIASLHHLTWMVAHYTDYILLVNRTHDAVQYALAQTGAEKVILVGHSAGGIVARAYLADRLLKPEHTPRNGYRKVMRLITLGSPLGVAEDHSHHGLRQAAWIDREFPGAYFAPDVHYLTVYGKLVEGKPRGTWSEQVAYRNYEYISGNGDEWGDGVVPNSLSKIDGVPSIELEGVGHSPLWGERWYLSDESTIRLWWSYFEQSDAPAIDMGRALA